MITKIVFEDDSIDRGNAKYVYDISREENESIMAYVVEDTSANKILVYDEYLDAEVEKFPYVVYIQTKSKKIFFDDRSFVFFTGFEKLTSIENLEVINTSKATTFDAMFFNCSSLEELDLSTFDTSNVTKMSMMFGNCNQLVDLDLSFFDTSNVTNMSEMFASCRNLDNLDLSSFDTLKVTRMNSMFSNCQGLTNLDLSMFDTSHVIEMGNMFGYCENLKYLNISNFSFSGLDEYSSFYIEVYNPNFVLNISNWSFDDICWYFEDLSEYGGKLILKDNVTFNYLKNEVNLTGVHLCVQDLDHCTWISNV